MAEEKSSKQTLWDRLRRLSRREKDKLEADMVRGRFERRQYAGDPQQADVFRVRTRNK